MEALRSRKRLQNEDRLRAGSRWCGTWDQLVFTTTSGTPINASKARRALAEVTDAAGLGYWHPHELRHSAASILSVAGVPLEHIADILGHDGVRMTALVYRHTITPSVTAGAAPMQRVLGRS
jgi:integrase